jgi:DNA-binding PadR family transcriptional regulator
MLRSLELFILALVQQGINTPYEIQLRAALSVGSTLPAFDRLLEKRLVKEEKPEARRRRRFTLTTTGQKELQDARTHLDQLSSDAAGDLEATLRLACLALFWKDTQLASKILVRAAGEFEGRSANSLRLGRKPVDSQSNLAAMYQSLLFLNEADRQKAAAKRMRALARNFESSARKARPTSGSRQSGRK